MKKAMLIGLSFVFLCLLGVAGIIALVMYSNEQSARFARFKEFDSCRKHETMVKTRDDDCVAYLMGYANQKSVSPEQVDESSIQAEFNAYKKWVHEGRPEE